MAVAATAMAGRWGLVDAYDPFTTTDPLDADSDNDGRKDGDEDRNHNGRIDPGETDPYFPDLSPQPWLPLLLLSGEASQE